MTVLGMVRWRPSSLTDFSGARTPETWFAENDPEGVAFEYEVLE
jgi:hypothetical protein